MQKSWQKRAVVVLLLSFFFLAAARSVSAQAPAQQTPVLALPFLNNPKLILHGISRVKVTNEDYYKPENSIGGFIGIKSSTMLGIAFSYLTVDFRDTEETTLVFTDSITSVGLFAMIQVPSLFEVAGGYGLARSDLACKGDPCKDFEKLRYSTSQPFMHHAYALVGLKAGKIYYLHVGFHSYTGGKVYVTDPTFEGEYEIPQNMTALSAGFSIAF